MKTTLPTRITSSTRPASLFVLVHPGTGNCQPCWTAAAAMCGTAGVAPAVVATASAVVATAATAITNRGTRQIRTNMILDPQLGTDQTKRRKETAVNSEIGSLGRCLTAAAQVHRSW